MFASRRALWVLCLFLPLALVACDSSADEEEELNLTASSAEPFEALAAADARLGSDVQRTLAAVRAATARYHSVQVALDADYVPASACVEVPGVGGMGYHYARFGLIDATVDASQPEILLYEPMRNGRLRLVAVEFMVNAAMWDATHNGPPEIAGQTYDDHRDPATWHGIPFAHYDLPAWVWQPNPAGMFVGLNPTVSCAYAP